MLKYPDILPKPEIQGYTETYALQTIHTSMEAGKKRVRQNYEDKPDVVTVSIILIGGNKKIFDYFYRQELQDGRLPFEMPLQDGGTVSYFDVQFMGQIKASLVTKDVYRLTASLDILKRRLIDKDEYEAMVYLPDIQQSVVKTQNLLNDW